MIFYDVQVIKFQQQPTTSYNTHQPQHHVCVSANIPPKLKGMLYMHNETKCYLY